MSELSIIAGDGYGRQQQAEEALCHMALVVLNRAYPGYDFLASTNFTAGVMNLDIVCEKPLGLQGHGFLLHLSSIMGADGERKILNAGGEMLERFGLRRDRADAEWRTQARENGLDIGNIIRKSKH